jgi:cytoskeleton protein RodZ
MTETSQEPSIGQTFRRRRTEKSFTIEQVAQDTKINAKFLRAIEEDVWDVFPARVYMEGFLKRYAEYLGLNGEEALQRLRPLLAGDRKPGFSSPSPQGESSDAATPAAPARAVWLLAGGAALVLVLALSYVKLEERQSRLDKPQVVEPLMTAPAPAPAPQAPASHDVRVSARAAVWVRVWLDGKVKFEGVLPGGQEKTWSAEDSLRVISGNPALLTVTVGQTPLSTSPDGPAGEIRWKAAPSAPAALTAPVPATDPKP